MFIVLLHFYSLYCSLIIQRNVIFFLLKKNISKSNPDFYLKILIKSSKNKIKKKSKKMCFASLLSFNWSLKIVMQLVLYYIQYLCPSHTHFYYTLIKKKSKQQKKIPKLFSLKKQKQKSRDRVPTQATVVDSLAVEI